MTCTRYHSLIVEEKSLPPELGEFPDMNRGMGVRLTPLGDCWFASLRRPLLALTAAGFAALLLAWLDAGLLLGRAAAPRHATAAGAVLGLLAAAFGVLLARALGPRLLAASGLGLPSFVDAAPGPLTALAFLGLGLLCGLLCGWVCARTALRAGSAGQRRGMRRLQVALVIGQLALVLLLAVRTGRAALSLRRLVGEDLGFRPDHLLTLRIDMEGPKYLADPPVTRLLAEQYLPRLAALPGVRQVALTNPTLPTDAWSGGYITAEDHDSSAADGTYMAMLHAVTPGYFELLGVPVIRGRGFQPTDRQSYSVVIGKAMADLLWRGHDPIGKRLKLDSRGNLGNPWLTVVGVAADARYEGIAGDKPPAPDIYLCLLQFPLHLPMTINFLVRPQPSVSAGELRSRLHDALAAIVPELPEYDAATLAERLAKQADRARFQLVLAAIAAGLALVLTAAGLAGAWSGTAAGAERERRSWRPAGGPADGETAATWES